ncbi:hypothetical protein [Snuella lapsa]|uniref:Cyclophilin-like domain-containing protein n=1 Tax=Snuella lapsa TaxID=870481 RepID=A0ABP6WRZ0_9FLAO
MNSKKSYSQNKHYLTPILTATICLFIGFQSSAQKSIQPTQKDSIITINTDFNNDSFIDKIQLTVNTKEVKAIYLENNGDNSFNTPILLGKVPVYGCIGYQLCKTTDQPYNTLILGTNNTKYHNLNEVNINLASKLTLKLTKN